MIRANLFCPQELPPAYRGGTTYTPPAPNAVFGQPPAEFQQAQPPPPQYPGYNNGAGAVHQSGYQPPALECGGVDAMVLIINFFGVILTSYVGLAYITRPKITGNRLVDCFNAEFLPKTHVDDIASKVAAGGALLCQWIFAFGVLIFLFGPFIFLGLAYLEQPLIFLFIIGLLFGPIFFLPLIVLNVLGGLYFLWFFWYNGRTFSNIPIWIYCCCAPSLVAWIIAGVLGLLILMEQNGVHLCGQPVMTMQTGGYGGQQPGQQYASYH